MTEGKRFEHQALNGVVFRDCSAEAAIFDDTNLAKANFTNVNLRGAKFTNANLSGVTIEDANIDGLTISGHDIGALIRAARSKSNPDTQGNSATLDGINPILQVPNLDEALAYYQEILGFKIAWQFDGPPNRVGLCRDNIGINLVVPGKMPMAPEVYISTDNVDSYYASVIARGAKIVVPLSDRFYGMRDFRIVDPGGNDLSFGQPMAEK